jgi:hypothetical protein
LCEFGDQILKNMQQVYKTQIQTCNVRGVGGELFYCDDFSKGGL